MAANTRDIRRRIKSVKNTAQITKAMQMVAASKMRKAQQAAVASRPYAEELSRLLLPFSYMVNEDESLVHPLLSTKPQGKDLVLLISTDKGLCGALNTNVLREVSRFNPETTEFVCVGKKGVQFLARSKRQVLADFHLKDNFSFSEAQSVAKFCMERFMEGDIARVVVLYTRYVNTLTQVPADQVVVPVMSFDVGNVELGRDGSKSDSAVALDVPEYLLEPNGKDFLASLLPHFVSYKIFHLILEARASEHSARMVAMKNATDNAKQLIKDLTLEYNKIRQASITTEILEIATAQMILS
ncbi:MAG: ATP synthase F1 subunit gamma [Verrucomicrobia bacterium]|nr:ATP synthase F1 subunit gamma [Verrucomicrobiota bacterium]